MKELETIASISNKINKNVINRLTPALNKTGLSKLPDKIVLLGLKEERQLQVYVQMDSSYMLLKNYPFTAYSGELGPKLKEGDKQIPEGIYNIEYLNPNSSYYLSMKLDFPNDFDWSKSNLTQRSDLGSDIFIHGNSVTIGCIPIGDEAIEELFILASNGLNNGIKVIISPRDFRKSKEFPEIDHIDWESELYQIISNELDILSGL